jgi:phosphatidylserine/phosphatidylglycerophosphate/cardiolipin synthase-like enzyme
MPFQLKKVTALFTVLMSLTMISPSVILAEDRIVVCFTPGENCTGEIVTALNGARISVLVQAYSFTSAPIAKALVNAHKRGVHVEAILDRSNKSQKFSSADFVAHAGIPTFIDSKHAIAHNKIMIIDGETIVTGSFNFTKAAQEKNAENLLVIHDKALAAQYSDNWHLHQKHSDIYRGK